MKIFWFWLLGIVLGIAIGFLFYWIKNERNKKDFIERYNYLKKFIIYKDEYDELLYKYNNDCTDYLNQVIEYTVSYINSLLIEADLFDELKEVKKDLDNLKKKYNRKEKINLKKLNILNEKIQKYIKFSDDYIDECGD